MYQIFKVITFSIDLQWKQDANVFSSQGELIVYPVCLSVSQCVCVFTHLNMNISETSWLIATKFYLKHHWGGGKAALGFGPDWIGTLVSMATDISHRVIMGKML